MFKKNLIAALTVIMVGMTGAAYAHFGMVIPNKNIVDRPQEVSVEMLFWHPFENVAMNLVKPAEAGLVGGGEKVDLLPKLKQTKTMDHETWAVSQRIKKPGDYYFYMVPTPYWEPAEDCYIVHYTKAPVSAMGAEEGWDEPVGLKMEIVPLTKPYGLYAGNSFTGQVLYRGKPLANAEVEVEFYNKDGKRKAPADAYVTQLVKADDNGIFSFTMPWPGWWGFAALHTDEDRKIKFEGKDKDVEVGGVIWVFTHE